MGRPIILDLSSKGSGSKVVAHQTRLDVTPSARETAKITSVAAWS